MEIIAGKRIVLGITGSIAGYKMIDLARAWTQAGAEVDVIMTEAATKFVAPLLLSSLTYRPVYTNMWSTLEHAAAHIALGRDADVLVVAPASANTIARLAAGMADDLIASAVLATTAPCCLAPAMETHMYHNPATQANLAILRDRGWTVLEPDEGLLASGVIGKGRLPAIHVIDSMVRSVLGRQYGRMAGRHVVVTAGGTHEALDPVRFIGNRSSGQMGYALATTARDQGATVTLISGPVALPPPAGVTLVAVESAAEMLDAVHYAIPDADLLLMAAAVADYRPAVRAEQKIKKDTSQRDLALERTADILASLVDVRHCIKVGFAAETEALLAAASEKLTRKQLDLIVANDAVASIGSPTSTVTLIDRMGVAQTLPEMPKSAVAAAILNTVLERWPDRLGRVNSIKESKIG